MKPLALLALVLVIALVSISAYLRLAHSGLGCEPWPGCYGRLGQAPASDGGYQQLILDAAEPLAWATPLHRLVASVLGLLVFAMTMMAWVSKNPIHRAPAVRIATTTLLGLTIYLAILGLRSGNLTSPAIVMGNLTGGFAMLAILGWLVLDRLHHVGQPIHNIGLWPSLAIGALLVQIVVGGLTSANFAATACTDFPLCGGKLLPGSGLATALDITREHQLNEYGVVRGGQERVEIHRAHRLSGIVTTLVIFIAAFFMTAQSALRGIGWLLAGLTAVEFGLGAWAVASDLPIGAAVAHNWLAAMLLLGLIALRAKYRRLPGKLEL